MASVTAAYCHPRAAGGPGVIQQAWIPASAGMAFEELICFGTIEYYLANTWIDADGRKPETRKTAWIPASSGMTSGCDMI
jgi:hypothetical protein